MLTVPHCADPVRQAERPHSRVWTLPHALVPLCAGDTLLVVKGGKGGAGVRAPSRAANLKEMQKQYKLSDVSCGSGG